MIVSLALLRAAMSNAVKKLPTVACTKCKGKGSHVIPETLAEVLRLFKGRRELSAIQARATLELESTTGAVNNRLEKLRRAGLLARRKKGRFYFYFLAPKPKPNG